MTIAIINWPHGENDPFTFFSLSLQSALQEAGRDSVILRYDNGLAKEVRKLHNRQRIDFAFSWQGIGSTSGFKGSTRTVWEDLGIPMVCFHGDHPSYKPGNHRETSAWIHHVYSTESFCRYANETIVRSRPARYLQLPQTFPVADPLPELSGEYFVFPKNRSGTEWYLGQLAKGALSDSLPFLAECARQIADAYDRGSRDDHHDLIDQLLPAEFVDAVRSGGLSEEEAAAFHFFHAALDPFYRNHIAERIVEELHDVPLQIYGRGWDDFAARQNPHHEFRQYTTLADGAYQFRSCYGIIDVAACTDQLHDRTGRAMAQRGSFLAASHWPCHQWLEGDYAPLFASGRTGELREKVEAIMADPTAHRERCIAFTDEFTHRFPMQEFVASIEEMIVQPV